MRLSVLNAVDAPEKILSNNLNLLKREVEFEKR